MDVIFRQYLGIRPHTGEGDDYANRRRVVAPHNKRMKLTGAAILVSRGMKVLQAAPAAYPYR